MLRKDDFKIMSVKKKNISPISIMHLIKLVLRSILFILLLVSYILNRINDVFDSYVIVGIVWIFFVIDMIFRLFPNKLESMGCQKEFKKNYIPIENQVPSNQSGKTTFIVAVSWILLNAIIGVLYFTNLIDKGIVLLISVAFSVCDIICILFFCPFQTWIMKNRCCTTCRIYNWDYAMMFTPLVLIPSVYTYSLLGIALILLIRWEITYKRHPERFSSSTNANLNCSNCKEKLCKHKKQLQGFLIKYHKKFFKRNSISKSKDV